VKAVQTRVLGPTDTKPRRIKAWAEGWGSVTISYPDANQYADAHFQAVLALLKKRAPIYTEEAPRVYGGLPNGDMCWCFSDSTLGEERWRRDAS